MATSTNYGWAEPDDSSLVKNGAADIRTLGDSIDTSVWNVGFGQAGKNEIINGNFAIAQRGISFATAHFSAGNLYTLDRWQNFWDNVPTSVTVSQQAFTAGAAPVAGYESASFYRSLITTVGTCTIWRTRQKIEDVRTLAGQTATVSFWAKADSARSISIALIQEFGSGGSSFVNATATTTSTFTLTTSWVRYSVTFTVPSISGKTIGTGSSLTLAFSQTVAAGSTLDLWGAQVEVGSLATPFQLASGASPQAELAMCQRYYFRSTSSLGSQTAIGISGITNSTTNLVGYFTMPVNMRIAPSSVDFSNIGVQTTGSGLTAISAVTFATENTNACASLNFTSSGFTANLFGVVRGTTGSGYIGLSAEL